MKLLHAYLVYLILSTKKPRKLEAVEIPKNWNEVFLEGNLHW